MIRTHLSRMWRDSRFLVCALAAFAMALIMAKPTAGRNSGQLVTVLFGTPTGSIPAAVLAAYLAGAYLERPVITSIYAGRPRWQLLLLLHTAVMLVAVVSSLLLSLLVLLIHGHSMLPQLWAYPLSDIVFILRRYFLWRLFFDAAMFSLVLLVAYATHQPYAALSVGIGVAVVTLILTRYQPIDYWWLPPNTAVLTFQYGANLRWLAPSIGLLIVAPLVGLLTTYLKEYR